jgi:hypothetical protein
MIAAGARLAAEETREQRRLLVSTWDATHAWLRGDLRESTDARCIRPLDANLQRIVSTLDELADAIARAARDLAS